MLARNGCKVVVLCPLTAAAIAVGSAQTTRSNSTNEALTCNGDGAQRSNQIHWPDGFHPEQADLFAHNEIFVHASCKKVFINLADAQAWPSWYPNSHDVKLLNSLDGKLHRGTRFSWDTHIRVTYRCTDEGDGADLSEQASILSYIDVLQTFAIFCACMVPLVLLMKRPPKGTTAAVH